MTRSGPSHGGPGRASYRAGREREGFTLVEALLAAAILAATVSAITLPFTAGTQAEKDSARLTLAVALAEELMEEILARPWVDPTGQNPGPGVTETSRPLYNSMDDYHGYQEAAGAIKDYYGQTVANTLAQNLSRSATVEYVHLSGQDALTTSTFMRITVTVAYRGRTVVTLQRLAYQHSP